MPARSPASTSSDDSLASSAMPTKPKLPITSIPDMRFEQSYLASVRGFVHEYDLDSADEMKKEQKAGKEKSNGLEEKEAPAVTSTRSRKGEPEIWLGRLRIQW